MSLFSIFLEGLLSFLSPCVLPLVPLYMSYLSYDSKEYDEDGNIKYKTPKVFLMTVFFVLGISVIFLLLALTVDSLKEFLNNYSNVISIVGGVVIIMFGLHETGIINISFVNSERRLNNKLDLSKMSYLKAFLLGFLFSFAWTPCIGPMLSSAIIIASTSKLGSLYILVYAAGLIVPFLITGLFTSSVLNFIKEKKSILKYTMILAGIIMIIYGAYMVYDGASKANVVDATSNNHQVEQTDAFLPSDTFYDQNENEIYLADYKGKYVMLNFITTWCGYCKAEIPEYISFANSNDNAECLYVMNSSTSGVSKEEIIKFINDYEIELTVIIDEDNILTSLCAPRAFPVLFVADKEGKFIGYKSGSMNSDGFNELLNQIEQK